MAGNVRILDGDTIDLDGARYRINGIDAPESRQTCTSKNGAQWACGKAATKMLRALTHGKKVSCEKLSTDRYGRFIARCKAGKTDMGRAMVESGMAWAYLKYSGEYEGAQRIAQKAKAGVWSGSAQPPWEFRASKRSKGSKVKQNAPAGCSIKGNISSSGKIYHLPSSPWYQRTKINTSKGERWFCSEAEAANAGWRPSKQN